MSEWIEYCLNIFRYTSLNADSWNNRNAISTSRYWLEKLFMTLEGYQDNIVLPGRVWLDETYYAVIMRDREHDEHGNLLRGLSRNQICVGVATDKTQSVCFVEGNGKPSQKSSYQAFKAHITLTYKGRKYGDGISRALFRHFIDLTRPHNFLSFITGVILRPVPH